MKKLIKVINQLMILKQQTKIAKENIFKCLIKLKKN